MKRSFLNVPRKKKNARGWREGGGRGKVRDRRLIAADGNESRLVNPSAHFSLCNRMLKMRGINRGHVGHNVPPCITNLYGPLRVRTPTTTSKARGDEERSAITRQNAERWKREMFLRREESSLRCRRPPPPPPSSPPPLPWRGAFLSISFSSPLFFRALHDALPWARFALQRRALRFVIIFSK